MHLSYVLAMIYKPRESITGTRVAYKRIHNWLNKTSKNVFVGKISGMEASATARGTRHLEKSNPQSAPDWNLSTHPVPGSDGGIPQTRALAWREGGFKRPQSDDVARKNFSQL